MAAAVQGGTLHSWGETPINAIGASVGETKVDKDGIAILYKKTLALRWAIIDEISTASFLVIGILESNF